VIYVVIGALSYGYARLNCQCSVIFELWMSLTSNIPMTYANQNCSKTVNCRKMFRDRVLSCFTKGEERAVIQPVLPTRRDDGISRF
jgi:hypothetical protein